METIRFYTQLPLLLDQTYHHSGNALMHGSAVEKYFFAGMNSVGKLGQTGTCKEIQMTVHLLRWC